jgi:hypothetical protein
MFDPLDLLQSSSRLDYRGLLSAVASEAQSSFAHGFRHPLLVGTGMLCGDLADSVDPRATAVFKPEDIQQAKRDSLQRAIFALWRQPGSESPPNCFVLGRAPKSDIVLADHAISRAHARIRVAGERYYLADLGATNPTLLNGKPVNGGEEQVIQINDEISISRYCFRLMDAASLHQLLQTRNNRPVG